MSAGNPYDPPKTENTPIKPRSGNSGRMITGILLLVAMVPASAVAFFCCCLAGATAAERPGQPGPDQALTIGMLAGAVGGLVVFVLMLWGGIRMIRRSP